VCFLQIFCNSCCSNFLPGKQLGVHGSVRVCDFCRRIAEKDEHMRSRARLTVPAWPLKSEDESSSASGEVRAASARADDDSADDIQPQATFWARHADVEPHRVARESEAFDGLEQSSDTLSEPQVEEATPQVTDSETSAKKALTVVYYSVAVDTGNLGDGAYVFHQSEAWGYLDGSVLTFCRLLGLSDTYAHVIRGMALRCVERIQCTDHSDLDVLRNVKIKRIRGADISNSFYVDGVVFPKNLCHRKMMDSIENVRILLLSSELEFQRGQNKFTSLDSLIEQELHYVDILVNKIVELRPNLLICEKSVARIAQERLRESGVTLIVNVPAKTLKRISQCTGATILPSIDLSDKPKQQQILGFCRRFSVLRLEEDPNQVPLVVLEGCLPDRGCTICLRGDDSRGERSSDQIDPDPMSQEGVLSRAKKVLRWAIRLAYCLKLEADFCFDSFCTVSRSSSSCLSSLKDRGKASSTFAWLDKLQQPMDLPTPSEGMLLFRKRLGVIKKQSGPAAPPVKKLPADSLARAAFCSDRPSVRTSAYKTILEKAKRRKQKNITKKQKLPPSDADVLLQDSSTAAPDRETDEAPSSVAPERETDDKRAEGAFSKRGSPARWLRWAQSSPCLELSEKDMLARLCGRRPVADFMRADGTGLDWVKVFDHAFHWEASQRVDFLFFWVGKQNQCVEPGLDTMRFLAPEDMTLQDFLENRCFNADIRKCPGNQSRCRLPLTRHVLCYQHLHHRLLVTIRERPQDDSRGLTPSASLPDQSDDSRTDVEDTLISSSNPSAYSFTLQVTEGGGDHLAETSSRRQPSQILTWHWCKLCQKEVTPRNPLTKASGRLPFSKFLNIFFLNKSYTCRLRECNHLVFRNHVKCFATSSLVVAFEWEAMPCYKIKLTQHLPLINSVPVLSSRDLRASKPRPVNEPRPVDRHPPETEPSLETIKAPQVLQMQPTQLVAKDLENLEALTTDLFRDMMELFQSIEEQVIDFLVWCTSSERIMWQKTIKGIEDIRRRVALNFRAFPMKFDALREHLDILSLNILKREFVRCTFTMKEQFYAVLPPPSSAVSVTNSQSAASRIPAMKFSDLLLLREVAAISLLVAGRRISLPNSSSAVATATAPAAATAATAAPAPPERPPSERLSSFIRDQLSLEGTFRGSGKWNRLLNQKVMRAFILFSLGNRNSAAESLPKHPLARKSKSALDLPAVSHEAERTTAEISRRTSAVFSKDGVGRRRMRSLTVDCGILSTLTANLFKLPVQSSALSAKIPVPGSAASQKHTPPVPAGLPKPQHGPSSEGHGRSADGIPETPGTTTPLQPLQHDTVSIDGLSLTTFDSAAALEILSSRAHDRFKRRLSTTSPLAELHLALPRCVHAIVIPVSDADVGSIIAYALLCAPLWGQMRHLWRKMSGTPQCPLASAPPSSSRRNSRASDEAKPSEGRLHQPRPDSLGANDNGDAALEATDAPGKLDLSRLSPVTGTDDSVAHATISNTCLFSLPLFASKSVSLSSTPSSQDSCYQRGVVHALSEPSETPLPVGEPRPAKEASQEGEAVEASDQKIRSDGLPANPDLTKERAEKARLQAVCESIPEHSPVFLSGPQEAMLETSSADEASKNLRETYSHRRFTNDALAPKPQPKARKGLEVHSDSEAATEVQGGSSDVHSLSEELLQQFRHHPTTQQDSVQRQQQNVPSPSQHSTEAPTVPGVPSTEKAGSESARGEPPSAPKASSGREWGDSEKRVMEQILMSPTKSHIKVDFDDGGADFSVTVYFAPQFHAIRHWLCGDDLSFIRSICRCTSFQTSGGKSGASFSISHDQRYIFKQVNRYELRMFLSFGVAFFHYFARIFFHQLPSTLTSVYGLFSVTYKNQAKNQRWRRQYVVLQNLRFNMDEQNVLAFDLKGVGRNRYVNVTGSGTKLPSPTRPDSAERPADEEPSGEELQQETTATTTEITTSETQDTSSARSLSDPEQQRPPEYNVVVRGVSKDVSVSASADNVQTASGGSSESLPSGQQQQEREAGAPVMSMVLWDQNFREYTKGFPLALPLRDMRTIESAIFNDTLLLSKLDVVDYSLLLLVNERTKEITMGMIDFFRPYTLDKQLESIGKSMSLLATGLSPTVISPTEYNYRFRHAIGTYFTSTVPGQPGSD